MVERQKLEAFQPESEKLQELVTLALAIDIEALKVARPDMAYIVANLDGGWVGEMMRTALESVDAFLEYRERLDAIVTSMGGGEDMLKGLQGSWPT